MTPDNEAIGYCPKQDQEYAVEVSRTAVRQLGFNVPQFNVELYNCSYGKENGCECLNDGGEECPIVVNERKDMELIIDSLMMEHAFFH